MAHDPHPHEGRRAAVLTAPTDPIEAFQAHLAEARAAIGEDRKRDATICVLATVDPAGQPHARFVLLKDADAMGFVFYTNYESDKAAELDASGKASIAMHWPEIGVQIRVEGPVARVDGAESDAYFASRPRGSRLGAWASAQSRPIADRASLEASLDAVTARFEGQEVPRPPHWGGYRLAPHAIELWYDGPYRLHDRFRYRRTSVDVPWQVQRLSP